MPEISKELYSSAVEKFNALSLLRPMRINRYEAGTILDYDITLLGSDEPVKAKLEVLNFVGGGFAGQVYKVKILEISSLCSLNVGSEYALKILIPPSNLARLFRNILYRIGFGAPFQLQVNPQAAKAGALWQKFIRRAASVRFKDENCVNDIHATFVDYTLGSCGEISNWVQGRTWRLEVDDHIGNLRSWRKHKDFDAQNLNSPEYRAKYNFMTGFVKLLHEMGAPEFARQYEWTTCKSQPNVLKRLETQNDPETGLIAVDFRAGLTLLPFLPMSPGDFKLIFQGLSRGSLVQFDRGDVSKLRGFVENHKENFTDLLPLLDTLENAEKVYRNSIPDITHNHVRLLYDGKLWKTISSSAITGWKTENLINDNAEAKLRKSKFKTFIFFLASLLPLLGGVLRKCYGQPQWRNHYQSLMNPAYFMRALKGRIFEKVIQWQRAGRVNEKTAAAILKRPILAAIHLPLSLIPLVWLHRVLTDPAYAVDLLHYIFVRPVKLYFNKQMREQWLRDMVAMGQKKHILSDDDAQTILNQLDEPYIQKYLISLVVHILTLPVTQIVSVTIAAIFYYKHPEMSDTERNWAVLGILAVFQVTPISPGSICRGIYAVGLAIKERDFKNYNIAVFISFFKYIGYLAFPIQMTYHYPALARFMAGHWATEAVHSVPVFGERGGLLEHWVFCLFYNWPLTIRRRMTERALKREQIKPRYWHIPFFSAYAALILIILNLFFITTYGNLITLKSIWWLTFTVPFLAGAGTTLLAGGMKMYKRIISGGVSAMLAAIIYWGFLVFYAVPKGFADAADKIAFTIFAFTVFGIIGVILTELTEK